MLSLGSLLRDHRIAQNPNFLDLDENLFSWPQPSRRGAAEPHSCRCSRTDDIARLESHHSRQILDQFWYSENQFTRVRMLQRLAAKLGLAVTGGSDWHGDTELGEAHAPLGGLNVPAEWLDHLEAVRERYR